MEPVKVVRKKLTDLAKLKRRFRALMKRRKGRMVKYR
jgi:hypothetical protein